MGTKVFITYIFRIVLLLTFPRPPLFKGSCHFVFSFLSGRCSSYLLFCSRFSSSSVPDNFRFSGLPGTAFLFHFNWNIFMKSYAGKWQINRNSRNRMSEKKILSERIPLNGQWNNRTSQTWPETRHGREGRSRTSCFFFYKIYEIKWQTGQSVLKSKGFYRTGGHFTGPVRRSDGISFSLQHVHFISCIFYSTSCTLHFLYLFYSTGTLHFLYVLVDDHSTAAVPIACGMNHEPAKAFYKGGDVIMTVMSGKIVFIAY